METSEATTQPVVGLVGLGALAALLAGLGVRVISHPEPLEATARIRTALDETGTRFPVIVHGVDWPGAASWIETTATRTRLARLYTGPSTPSADGVVDIPLPAKLGEVLTAVGVTTETPPGLELGVDGTFVTDDQPTPPSVHQPPDPPARVPDAAEVAARFAARRSSAAQPEEPVAAPTLPFTPPPAPVTQGTGAASMRHVIVCCAGRGGVGKSMSALAIADRAANAGLKVVLVDANDGQGDVRDYLQVGAAGFPSIYQAAVSGSWRDALVDPDSINAHRPGRLGRIGFGVILAPPDHLSEDGTVTPATYADVIAGVREVADLVVLDTQIIESRDAAGMVHGLIAPLLRSGGWLLGVTDLSTPGYSKLERRLTMLRKAGVPSERVLTFLNKLPADAPFNERETIREFNNFSTFLGTVGLETDIQTSMNQGLMVSAAPSLAPLLDAALFRVTGLEPFNAAASSAVSSPTYRPAGYRRGKRKLSFGWRGSRR